MTKLERAKRITRQKWRELLQNLPGMTVIKFHDAAGCNSTCGFCQVYADCTLCPAEKLCSEMDDRRRVICGNDCYEPAAKLCRWVLRKISKVE